MGISALVGVLVCFDLLFIMLKRRQARESAPQSSNVTARGSLQGDEELDELKSLVKAEEDAKKQNKA